MKFISILIMTATFYSAAKFTVKQDALWERTEKAQDGAKYLRQEHVRGVCSEQLAAGPIGTRGPRKRPGGEKNTKRATATERNDVRTDQDVSSP